MDPGSPVTLSIVTVCWNDLSNVQRTVESLECQVETTGWEHVLVDGASKDGTADWYRQAGFKFPHCLLSEPDNGIFDAMNKSLDIVNGDYVVFMNAGDRFADNAAVGRILARLSTKPAWGYGIARIVDIEGNRVRPQVGKIPYSRTMHLLGAAKICHQAVVMRVDLINRLGRFDLRMGNAADYHMLVKAAAIEPPATWADINVDYLAGGISAVENHEQLWRRHRARVDALEMKPAAARLDRAWTALQLARVRATTYIKPVLEPIYLRLLN